MGKYLAFQKCDSINSYQFYTEQTTNIIEKNYLSERLKKVTHTEYDRRLFNAIFIIMYHACLRVSEVAQSSNSKHTVSVKQMFIRDGKLVLCLKSYKHSNQRTSKIILPACKGCICPVRAYKEYKKLRKRIPGPFFLKENGKAVSRNVIAKMLKKVIEALSLNPKHFNTHSFRIGKITDLATTGSSSNKIKSAGRFHSNAYGWPTLPQFDHGYALLNTQRVV